MIKQIDKIINVGPYVNFDGKSVKEFGKANLIYGENG